MCFEFINFISNDSFFESFFRIHSLFKTENSFFHSNRKNYKSNGQTWKNLFLKTTYRLRLALLKNFLIQKKWHVYSDSFLNNSFVEFLYSKGNSYCGKKRFYSILNFSKIIDNNHNWIVRNKGVIRYFWSSQ